MNGDRCADAARGALDWIDSVAVDAAGGRAWQDDGTTIDHLYSGTAGVLLGCAELTAAGIDAAPVAAGARDRLLHIGRHPDDAAGLEDDGAFTGWAGIALALDAWARAAEDSAAADGAERVLSAVAGRASTAGGCTDVISGDAGILLALTTPGGGELPKERRAAAEVLAERLVAVAETGEHGPRWRMEAGWEYLMPGFSHGTAGVAYALATAGRALEREDLLAVAVRAAEGLLAAGHRDGGWALPMTVPALPGVPEVAYGWCHGPTGTVRLFTLLDGIDPAPRWREATDACTKALRDSRLPARLYPGYWDNLARCCGTAGVGQLLLDRYRATGEEELLTWADTLATDVLDRALTTPPGLRWSNTEHTKTLPELPPEPGFMQGAAGIAGWLARLGALHAGATAARPGPPWL